jgi:glutamate 5-kinase
MALEKAKIVVIKIGSSSLVDENFVLRKKWIKSLCDDVAALIKKDKKVILVTSGAVALGRNLLAKKKQKLRIEEKQAAAACGQPLLMSEYSKAFASKKIDTAQILLTINDIENRRSYLNAKNTFETLLENNVVPIVNENDSVATEELKFGDNDRLSALVAQMVGADHLVILSDIDGLYTDDPNKNKDAKHIAVVGKINEDISIFAKGVSSKTGSGGMATKIQAAKIASEFGCNTIIAKAGEANSISKLIKGAKHTLFKAEENPAKARKKWILNSQVTNGKIFIDDGAAKALQSHKSLLPIGIKKIEGKFNRGDKVSVFSLKGKEIAKGISAYSSSDINAIMGKRSSEIEKILGFTGREAAVHVDDLVLV